MTNEIIQLAASDYDEFLTYQNRAFQVKPEETLELGVPTMYQAEDWYMQCNYAIRHNGELAANIGLYPIIWHIGNRKLRVAGIGGVSTKPELRAKGMMGRLLRHIKKVIRDDGYALSYLGGQRQRYRYFGWESCGTRLCARISTSCIRHHFRQALPSELNLAPIDESSTELAELKALHDRQCTHCDRSAGRFGAFLRQWMHHPYIARNGRGHVVGYAILNREENEVVELIGSTADTLLQILWAISKKWGRDFTLLLDTIPTPVRHTIASFAESLSTSASGNWQVFSWPLTLTALASARHDENALMHGSVVIGIDDPESRWRLTVDQNGPHCQMSNDQPDLCADAPTLMQLLFGPWPPSRTMPLPPSAAILDAWCPLPLGIPKQDHV